MCDKKKNEKNDFWKNWKNNIFLKNHFFRIFMIVKFLCSARASCICLRDIPIRVHAACTHHVNKTRAREFIFLTYHIWAFLWAICDMSQITSRNRPVQKFWHRRWTGHTPILMALCVHGTCTVLSWWRKNGLGARPARWDMSVEILVTGQSEHACKNLRSPDRRFLFMSDDHALRSQG